MSSRTSQTVVADADADAAVSMETVSVVIPAYNEERFIGQALNQLAEQYEPERYEIVVVDGMSTDATRERVRSFQQEHPEVALQLIDNPARNIPTALNIGVAAARGEIIARMDAHAVPSAGYIRRCVEVLNETTAGVVGMPCRVQPGARTLMARAIAEAVSHPFGIGDAKYRLQKGDSPQEAVDTVAFACFRKSLWSELGGFNESLLTNEDYEFNYRVRQSGRDVLLDRSGHCDYFARTTLRELGKQYARYGEWKAKMILLHPQSVRPRHLVAPLFVLSLIICAIGGVIWKPLWLILAIETITYVFASLAAAAHASSGSSNRFALTLMLPLVFCTIHVTWGTNFLLKFLGIRTTS